MIQTDSLGELQELYLSLQSQMRERWNRDLPFEELLFDRWERAKRLGFGENASIYHNSYVYGEVKVGKNTWIGPYTLLDGTGGLIIGDWCCISSNVHIYTHDTVNRFVSGGQEPTEYAPVIIEDNCYIGPHSLIKSGVTIHHHCVIGASTFVNKDIPAYSIAVGTPAKVIGKVSYDEKGKLIYLYDKGTK